MQLTRYKLGDLIVQRREKNEGYDVPIRGVSREGFIKPKQQEADTSIYNVFYRNDFVFNPARMELNSIALNLEFDKALCSSLYEIFYVKDESIVLPEFLNLHIKRDEFARHCEYIGSGSAREYCRVAQISEFDIDLPPIDVQQKIVDANRLLVKRIETNKKLIASLEQTAQTLYIEHIEKKRQKKCLLKDLCGFQEGYVNPSQECPEYFGGDVKWLRANDVNGSFIFETSRTLTKLGFESAGSSALLFEPQTLVITKSGTIGRLGILCDYMCGNRAVINIKPFEKLHLPFIFFYLKNKYNDLVDMAVGSAQANLYVPVLAALEVYLPDDETMLKYCADAGIILNAIKNKAKDCILLEQMQTLLLSKMGA